MEARVDPNRESKARVKPAPKPKNEQAEPSKEYPSTNNKEVGSSDPISRSDKKILQTIR